MAALRRRPSTSASATTREIDNNRAVQGQNGLMVTRSTQLKIWNNTFSWMSGLGIGLYRTTDSRDHAQPLDWDVRGYSHGFYNRGQDSAGLLMYEQSSRNVVAYNSITHGGDGLFLWAGQSTMDTGQGGANDNVFYDNDFSHAVANGIEATFSRNTVRHQPHRRLLARHLGRLQLRLAVHRSNASRGNTEAIAIEHGQNIAIIGNTFTGDETAIRLWANATQDPNWGYPKARDTRSRDYLIAQNTFIGNKTALNVLRTTGVAASRQHATRRRRRSITAGVTRVAASSLRSPDAAAGPWRSAGADSAGAMDAKLPDGARRGRATIIVDEWGPYDYLSPKLWPSASRAIGR